MLRAEGGGGDGAPASTPKAPRNPRSRGRSTYTTSAPPSSTPSSYTSPRYTSQPTTPLELGPPPGVAPDARQYIAPESQGVWQRGQSYSEWAGITPEKKEAEKEESARTYKDDLMERFEAIDQGIADLDEMRYNSISPDARGGLNKPKGVRQEERRLRGAARAGMGKDNEVYDLKPTAYEDMTHRQKSLVEWNTDLKKAIEYDLAHQYGAKARETYRTGHQMGADQDKLQTYDEAVVNILGDGKGSEKFMPETVSLLSDADLDLTGFDLDQVIAGKLYATNRDISLLDRSAPTAVSNLDLKPNVENRRDVMSGIANDYGSYVDNVLAKTPELIGNARKAVASSRDPEALGGIGREYDVNRAGFGPANADPNAPIEEQRNADFRFYMAKLADPKSTKNDINQVWTMVNANYDDTDKKLFMEFIDVLTRNAIRYNVPLAPDQETRDPAEIRKLAGLK